ncbi:hypothetical protein LSH36_141g06053 [Paralvinella palmiformis]|uniref:Uncharacterized protein n=1 Tax=Paralvinella palmiformis TaxID=53620 RepID=A0AAD9JW17_9ANNE|nr:hypothetical protein LSH36_141g06053 [Paralvinella palmiformis]
MAQLNKTSQHHVDQGLGSDFGDLPPSNQPSNSNPQIIIQQGSPMTQFNIERDSVPWSWGSLITAMVSTLCCFLLGSVATVMAILSYVDHSTKQFERSQAKKSVAYGLGIAGIVIGTIIVVTTIVLTYTLY